MNHDELNELRQVACETAVSAGKLARQMWSEPRQIQQKGFRDLVTDADYATQQCLTDAIQARFPEHGFLTEEEDSQLPSSGPIIWIIDPIDGTTNYSRQIPEFCVSVAACQPVNGAYKPLAAAIYDPMRQELFSAALGQGATLQIGDGAPKPTAVSQISETSNAVLAVDWSSAVDKRLTMMEAVNQLAEHSFTVRAIGTAALAMAWVAAGRVDAYLNFGLRPWDVAAAMLLIQESGGALTSPAGEQLVWRVAGMTCWASNGRLKLNLPAWNSQKI